MVTASLDTCGSSVGSLQRGSRVKTRVILRTAVRAVETEVIKNDACTGWVSKEGVPVDCMELQGGTCRS